MDSDPQLAIFDDTTATDMKPRLNCTNSDDCPAEADEHLDTCPVEHELRRTFGF